MSQRKVFLSAGHGGKDPGAVGINGIKEKDLNLKVALSTKKELERHNILVGISRTKDEDDDVNQEVKECNNFKPELGVAIHFNAGGGSGFESICHIGGGKSLELAVAVEKRMISAGRKSRGVKTRVGSDGKDFFGWIRMTNCPSIIAEMEFVDNQAIKDMDEDHELEHYGKVVAWGILDCMGIKVKPNGPDIDLNEPPSTNVPNYESKTVVARDTEVYYEGKNVNGMIIDGTTVVPVRLLCELIGSLDVEYKDKQVFIKKL